MYTSHDHDITCTALETQGFHIPMCHINWVQPNNDNATEVLLKNMHIYTHKY